MIRVPLVKMSAALDKEHVGNDLVPEIDDLVPTKAIKENVEFGTSSCINETASPDYIFRLTDLRTLIQHETELMGKEFPLPALNCSAQIKCDVKYDQFRLSIRFLDQAKSGHLMDMGLKTMKIFNVIQNRRFMINTTEELVHQFPFQSQLVYGTFTPISTLSYAENFKKDYDKFRNSVTLHLHVKVATEDLFLDDGIWLWKVDVRLRSTIGPNQVKELGLTPFLHIYPDGLRVQIRLYVQNDNCFVELRVVNESEWSGYYVINLYVIHPTEPTRPRLTSSFDFKTWGPIRLSQPRYSHVLVFAGKHKLEEYVSEGKLLVKVEIKQPLIF